jgi:DNA-binding beta-propeller fold protein YncE
MNRIMVFGVVVIALFAAAISYGASSPNYHLASEIPVPGDEGWDYLSFDPAGARVFVSHGSRVQAIDAIKGTVIGQIDDTPGVHGIAIAQDLGRGYISAGRSGMVVVFDLKTLARVGEVKATGDNPDAILYEPKTHRVFTFNGRGRNATVIDAKTNAVIGTIALDSKPEFAQTNGEGEIYVNLEDKNSLAVIDASTATVKKTWPITGCEEPSGLALDNKHHRLFAVCSNKVMAVIDATNGNVIDKLPIGAGADGVAFDSKSNLAFASCGEGVMTVVHEDSPEKFSVAQTVVTKRGARTVTLDEKTHRVYTVTAQFGAPPAPTADQPRPRPRIEPNSFALLVLEP